ncbi:MAG TPA: DNA primase, partial [Candidatus Saccharimonadales bacterium]|nr:DNA primase [Candidatus Saccharimonadales bacterium]
GDILTFVMMMEGVEFKEALELLARRAGVELTARADGGEGAKTRERLYQANSWAVKYFQACLVKNPAALDYVVKQRRLKRSIIADFEIGYAPESWDGLVKFLRKHGFNEAEMVKAGLAGPKRSGSGVYDMFRGRVMFTICDRAGRPIGFTGRVLSNGLDGGPKYLNTPQTALYDKSRAIFGLHLAKEAMRTADEAVLVEGNMDVVASHQAGVRQVVAASGTALTFDQLKAISKFSRNIKIAFDQDSAGLKASARAIEMAQKLGLSLHIIEVGAKDPDELIQQDAELWRTAIKDAQDVFGYWFSRSERELNLKEPIGKRQFSDRIVALIQTLADPVERETYMKMLSEKIGVSLESVKQKVEQAPVLTQTLIKVPDAKPSAAPAAKSISPSEVIETSILAVGIVYPDCRVALDDLDTGDFHKNEHQAIFALLKQHSQADAQELARLLPEQANYVKILALRGEEEFTSLAPADRSFEAFRLSRRLQTLAQQQTQADISQQLHAAQASGDTALARSLLERFQKLIDAE